MIYLLILRLQGREYRFSTEPEPLVAGGYLWLPGLEDPHPTQSASDVDWSEIPIEVYLSVEAWTQLAQMRSHGRATAQLALLDGARILPLLDGRMDRPVWGSSAEKLAFSLVDAVWEDRALMPSPDQVVSSETWPVSAGMILPDGPEGAFYPYIFGAPGFSGGFGWPAILVEISETTGNNDSSDATVLISGHPMEADEILLSNRTTGQSATVGISWSQDNLGQGCSIAIVSGSSLGISSGDELWASATQGGGVDAGARGAAQLARWLLERSTLRIDYSRMVSNLDSFKLDFFINEPQSPYQIIQDYLLRVLPAVWKRGYNGYFLAELPWIDRKASLQIDTEQGAVRDGEVTATSSAEIYTDLSVQYAKDDATGDYRKTLILDATSSYGARAFAEIGARRMTILELPSVEDDATALLIGSLRARDASQTRQGVAYLVPGDERIQPGARIEVTDAEILWSARPCWIVSVERSTEELTRIEVQTLTEPL